MANWSSRPGSRDSPSADSRDTVAIPDDRDADHAPDVEPRRRSWGMGPTWSAVFLAAFAVYAATANRGAQWQDSGYHILRVVNR